MLSGKVILKMYWGKMDSTNSNANDHKERQLVNANMLCIIKMGSGIIKILCIIMILTK